MGGGVRSRLGGFGGGGGREANTDDEDEDRVLNRSGLCILAGLLSKELLEERGFAVIDCTTVWQMKGFTKYPSLKSCA